LASNNHRDINDRHLVWILGLLSAFSALSVDLHLPSLPAIAQALSTTASNAQLTLSAFFIGFAIGQLIYGPLSDHYGRQPVLLSGIGLYIVSSVLCGLSTDIDNLILFRFLQALGGGAGTVIARAIVRDKFASAHGAHVLSSIMLITALAPLFAPIAGGYVLAISGWRANFWIMASIGIASFTAVLLWLPESNPNIRSSKKTVFTIFSGYLPIVKNCYTMRCTLSGCFGFAGLFAFVSGSPFLYVKVFGVSPQNYGYFFALNVVGVMLGSIINRRLVIKHGTAQMMKVGTRVQASAGILLLLISLTGTANLTNVVVLTFFYITPLSLIATNALTRAGEGFPSKAGTVSALFGAGQFGFGAISATAVGLLYDGTPFAMCTVICVCGILGFLANTTASQ
jgi:DHA1 family bicyclomycin/chloramphenicol resistance-like MFS transporter